MGEITESVNNDDRMVEVHNTEIVVDKPVVESILKGFKEITLAKHGQVRLYRPGIHIVEMGDKIVSGVKLSLMRDRDNVLPLERELRKQYESRDVWSADDDDRLGLLRDRIIRFVNEIRAPFDDKFMALAGKWIDDVDTPAWEAYHAISAIENIADGGEPLKTYVGLRKDSYEKTQKEYRVLRDQYNSLFSGTIETFANYERELYYCTMCYKKEDGTRLWASIEDLRNDDESFSEAVTAANRYWNGLDTEEMRSFFEALLGE